MPIDEVLRDMDDLIRQGNVNYAAISDTPAWIVSKGNIMAELMGWSQFIALQIEYSLLQRTPERDLDTNGKTFWHDNYTMGSTCRRRINGKIFARRYCPHKT